MFEDFRQGIRIGPQILHPRVYFEKGNLFEPAIQKCIQRQNEKDDVDILGVLVGDHRDVVEFDIVDLKEGVPNELDAVIVDIELLVIDFLSTLTHFMLNKFMVLLYDPVEYLLPGALP